MTVISLWKAAEGGRSFRAVKEALAFEGIACEKSPEPSRWEGRYDIFVMDEQADRAREFLLAGRELFHMQRTDDVTCRVSR